MGKNTPSPKLKEEIQTIKEQVERTKPFPNAVGGCRTLSNSLLRMCGISLTPYQELYRELIFRKVLRRKPVQVPIQWCRQSGKTEINVHSSIALAIYHISVLDCNYPVAIVTPSRTEQGVIVTRERVRMYAERLKPWLKPFLNIDFYLDKGRRTNDYVFRSEQGFEAPFHCVSASPAAFQKGQTYPLMFLEQVEDMDEFVMQQNIFPFGAGSNIGSVTVLAGSATNKVTNNYYFQEIQKVREKEGLAPPYFVDDFLASQYRPGYKEYAQLMRDKLGENHPIYLTQFRNIWVQPINKPFSRELLLSLTWTPIPIPDQPAIPILTPPTDAPRAVGIDVAKEVDSTVLTGGFKFGSDCYVERWLEMQGLDYEQQADDAADFIARGHYSEAKIDKNGPGNAFADGLERRLREHQPKPIECLVVREALTAQSNNRIYLQYDNEVTHKRFHYPAEKTIEQATFFHQHEDVQRKYSKENRVKLEAPSGKHDDYVCSAALLVDALLNPSTGPTVLGEY